MNYIKNEYMKNLKCVLTFFTVLMISIQIFAQIPQKFNYQTVCRDSANAILVNKQVSFRFSIHDSTTTGLVIYQEVHNKTTNNLGLINFEIGNGNVQIGNFSSIQWESGDKYFEVEIDLGYGYISTGTSQLISVPYALHANTAENISGGINETDPNFVVSPAYGISTTDINNWNNKLDFEVDSSVTNELQQLSISNDTIYLSNGGFVKLPSNNGFIHYIGELYGGGIIVALWKESGIEKGLIASLEDLSTGSTWSNITSTAVGSSAQSTFDGQANTNAIISQPGHTYSAAKLCDDYVSGGFNDWYLPSAWELNQCYNSAFIVNNILGSTFGFNSTTYWSSTETANNTAHNISFIIGSQGNNTFKTFIWKVRAVRRF